MDSSQTRRPHFNKDDGLASVADVAMKPVFFPRRGKHFRTFDEQLPRQPHFLENCFLCRKHIGGNKDIYMYRGDTPFCSEECRQEQIETDEAKENEKKWNKSLRKNQKKSNSSPTKKSQGYPFLIGTVAAA